MKIILNQFLAANAFYIETNMLDSTRVPLDTTFEVVCDWPWARRHAFAIAGFIIGLFFFPLCMYWTGFRPDGNLADKFPSRAQSDYYDGENRGCFICLQSMGAMVCRSLMYVIIIICFFGIFGFFGIIIDYQIYKKHCT